MKTLPTYAIYRREWAHRLIGSAAGLKVPAYDSPAFLRLPEGSPQQIAAVVRAAECWARDGDELEDQLRHEIEYGWRARKTLEDAAYVDQIESHRDQWAHLRHLQPLSPAALQTAEEAATRDLYTIGRGYMEERRWA